VVEKLGMEGRQTNRNRKGRFNRSATSWGSSHQSVRVLRIKPVEQQHDGKMRESLLDTRGQAVKGLLLTVLFARFLMIRLILEKLTHQGDHHAVAETQAGLQDIDVVLAIGLLIDFEFGFPFTFALLRMLVPQHGEGDLLATVDGEGITVVGQVASACCLINIFYRRIPLVVKNSFVSAFNPDIHRCK
jgi:hypothetical protein